MGNQKKALYMCVWQTKTSRKESRKAAAAQAKNAAKDAGHAKKEVMVKEQVHEVAKADNWSETVTVGETVHVCVSFLIKSDYQHFNVLPWVAAYM